MQFDVESLRTFLTVLDTGGMTRASEVLGISPDRVRLVGLTQRLLNPLEHLCGDCAQQVLDAYL